MPSIHVCPLHLVPSEALRLKPSGLITLLSPGAEAPDTPKHLTDKTHMRRLFHDITTTQPGYSPPSEGDVKAIVDFARDWDRKAPLLIHCFAGISRSTAAAYIAASALRPDIAADDLADRLRRASPTATPNILMIEYADVMLQRGGRMVEAIEELGQGHLTSHGEPFKLAVF